MLKLTVCALHEEYSVVYRCFELLLVPYDVGLKHNIISLFEAMFKSTESIESINA